MNVTLSLFAGAGAQFLDNSGNVLTGGKIYSYYAGTTTPLATYTSNLGNVPQPNPIILDSAGRIPTGEIWVNLGFGYKFVVKDANDVLIATYDNIPSSNVPTVLPIYNDASSISYEQGTSTTAGSFLVGKTYLITSIGSTNFQTIGAVSNTVGTFFVATGAGSGTGTAELSRTVEAKLREIVSVKDFGAIGDGVTDDTTAINNAITAAQGKTLYIPAGQYKVSSTINFGKNMSVLGEGAEMSVFVCTQSGVGVRINQPLYTPSFPLGLSTGDNYNLTFEKFGILANANTTIAFFMMRCVYCNFKDILIKAPQALTSNFVGFRVSGAMYLNTFENCIFDTIEQTAANVGIGWSVGNGQNEVVQAFAATNVNTFITCRAVRIGTGLDVDNAGGCIFINVNLEENAVASINIRGNYNQFFGPWIESGSIYFNTYTPADGAGGFGAAQNPIFNSITTNFPIDVVMNNSSYGNFYNCRLGNITIGANCTNTQMTQTFVNGSITNNGSDGNLNYYNGGNSYQIIQNGASTVYSNVMQNGNTKITMNGGQYIESQRFGNFKFNSAAPFEFIGAAQQLDKITAPSVAPANSGFLFVQDNGAGKMQLAARFPSGTIQVIATEP